MDCTENKSNQNRLVRLLPLKDSPDLSEVKERLEEVIMQVWAMIPEDQRNIEKLRQEMQNLNLKACTDPLRLDTLLNAVS